MITIYDIAKAAGVAPTTVSKAFNNYVGVNDKTRKKIMDTAASLGYLPNVAARSLTTKRSNNIGVVIYIKDSADLTHYLFIRILNKFKNVLASYGYDITLISKEHNILNSKTFIDHCRMRQVDGILMFGDYSSEPMREILDSEIPSVGFDYMGSQCSGVSSNNSEKMKELTELLIKLGHRQIKYFCGSENYVTAQRIEGFKAALDEAGISCSPDMITEVDYLDPEKSFDATEFMIEREKHFTAVIYPDDFSAIGGLKAFNKYGVRVPDDISVASFDGIEFAQITNPPLTTVKQDTDKIGEALANKLLKLIENKEEPIENIITPAYIVQTSSVKKNS